MLLGGTFGGQLVRLMLKQRLLQQVDQDRAQMGSECFQGERPHSLCGCRPETQSNELQTSPAVACFNKITQAIHELYAPSARHCDCMLVAWTKLKAAKECWTLTFQPCRT